MTLTRYEKDSMGSVEVPHEAYYGAQTERARKNGLGSGLRPPIDMIHMLALIKGCAADVNRRLGLLPAELSEVIVQAAEEVSAGRFDDQFVVDLFQTGSGTSTNMNVNEVIAGRANELITGKRGGREPVHPNDHVNLGQSSNDVIPSAIHLAGAVAIHQRLLPALAGLLRSFKIKAREFAGLPKLGRTHLQDALPVFLGQEFGGYARQMELAILRLRAIMPRLHELALGGTAVGTGAGTHPDFARRTIDALSARTGIEFVEAQDHFEAQASRDALVETSGCLKTIATGLVKIAGDIRLMASGPRGGLAEIRLPALQPGSSMMPGKVNPVVPEIVIQAAYRIIGNDTTATFCGQEGILELNTAMPLMAHVVLQSIELLGLAAEIFAFKCIDGLQADREICRRHLEQSPALATLLVPYVGYDTAADMAEQSAGDGKTVRQVALERRVLPAEKINELFDSILLNPPGRKRY